MNISAQTFGHDGGAPNRNNYGSSVSLDESQQNKQNILSQKEEEI